jgi:hypothetical protein
MRALYWMTFLGAIFLAGCSGSKVSVNQSAGAEIKPIHRLAIMPDSGVLGDTIGRALQDRGFNIVTAAETDAMVGGIRINQLGVTAREYYAALHDKGVDAALTASTQMAGDGRPDKANAMVMNTASGESLMDIAWENGWGGYGGSDADQVMRKSTSEAAQEMAQALVTRLRLK